MAFHSVIYFTGDGLQSGGGGFLGVDLFFVLSGFLITRIVIERFEHDGEKGPGRFYLRRFLRLFPALAVVAIAQFAFVAAVWPGNTSRAAGDAAAVLFYVANFRAEILLGHTWSLAVEEQFYLVAAPLLIVVLKRRIRPSVAAIVVLMTVVAIFMWRFAAYDGFGHELYKRTDMRADTILIGVLAGLLWPQLARKNWRYVGLAGLALLLGAVLTVERDTSILYQGGFTIVAIACACAVIAAAQGSIPILGWGPLVAVGKLAYSLYLWHFVVFELVYFSGAAPLLGLPIAFSISTALALLSWRFVEGPALRLKSQITRSPGGGVALGEPTQPQEA